MSDESLYAYNDTCNREFYSGPDRLRQHRKSVFKWPDDVRHVGHTMVGPSPQATLDCKYILRYPESAPFPKPKRSHIGEIGYGVDKYHNRYHSG